MMKWESIKREQLLDSVFGLSTKLVVNDNVNGHSAQFFHLAFLNTVAHHLSSVRDVVRVNINGYFKRRPALILAETFSQ